MTERQEGVPPRHPINERAGVASGFGFFFEVQLRLKTRVLAARLRHRLSTAGSPMCDGGALFRCVVLRRLLQTHRFMTRRVSIKLQVSDAPISIVASVPAMTYCEPSVKCASPGRMEPLLGESLARTKVAR